MRYKNNTPEFRENLAEFREMEEVIPMTSIERSLFLQWVRNGHEVDSNPWNYSNSDGSPMNYLKARRVRYGYSHGPGDSWEYSVPITLNTQPDFQAFVPVRNLPGQNRT